MDYRVGRGRRGCQRHAIHHQLSDFCCQCVLAEYINNESYHDPSSRSLCTDKRFSAVLILSVLVVQAWLFLVDTQLRIANIYAYTASSILGSSKNMILGPEWKCQLSVHESRSWPCGFVGIIRLYSASIRTIENEIIKGQSCLRCSARLYSYERLQFHSSALETTTIGKMKSINHAIVASLSTSISTPLKFTPRPLRVLLPHCSNISNCL